MTNTELQEPRAQELADALEKMRNHWDSEMHYCLLDFLRVYGLDERKDWREVLAEAERRVVATLADFASTYEGKPAPTAPLNGGTE